MDRGYGWVVVGIGALMTCVAVGAMFSLAVFLEPMTRDTGWSRAAVSSAMTLNFIAMGAAGAGLALASRATSETGFLLSYGEGVILGAGLLATPSGACSPAAR